MDLNLPMSGKKEEGYAYVAYNIIRATINTIRQTWNNLNLTDF